MIPASVTHRRIEGDTAQSQLFDVAIIGAGVTGGCLFHELRRQGYRVLLIDKADFAGGTSQASAMMLWGGLSYLRSLDVATVARLSNSREDLVRSMTKFASPRKFRYIVREPGFGNALKVQSALYLYWMLGAFRRERPRMLTQFAESSILNPGSHNCYEYEEGYLPDSDARFVLEWILRARDVDNPALNHCAVSEGHYDPTSKQWHLDLDDRVLNRRFTARARLVVNAAGVWTDPLNRQFGIETPYKHILSKGVFLGLRRDPRLMTTLIVEKADLDCYALIPWGPIALWGPTETFIDSIEQGFAPDSKDVQSLSDEFSRHFSHRIQPDDIVSLRCGVRGLAVPRTAKVTANQMSSSFSRKYVVHHDRYLPWVSVHGGKLTSCVSIAQSAINAIGRSVRPSFSPAQIPESGTDSTPVSTFPGLPYPVPSVRACLNESCWTLEDYLRRRTNISQWVPRGGLGANNENVKALRDIAEAFWRPDGLSPEAVVDAYQRNVESRFDNILSMEVV